MAAYIPSRRVWEEGGYESLISRVAIIDVQGVKEMVSTNLELLGDLYGQYMGRD